MSDTAETEPLLPIGEALVEVDSDRVYEEAKRRYEALVNTRDALNNHASSSTNNNKRKVHATRATQRVSISNYYADLFNAATANLDPADKYRLLTLCLSYKSKARILHYLDLLPSDSFSWVPLLKDIVRTLGIDSEFDTNLEQTGLKHDRESEQAGGTDHLAISGSDALGQEDEQLPSPPNTGSPSPAANPALATGDPARTDQTSTRPSQSTEEQSEYSWPYFVISTLPIAFPTIFFTAYAQHVVISKLTPASILAYPPARLLRLSTSLESKLTIDSPKPQQNVTSRRRSTRKVPSILEKSTDATDASPWTALCSHLSETKEILRLPDLSAMQPEDGDDGYEELDLEMWCAAWTAERQSAGMKEKGQEERSRIRRRSSRRQSAVSNQANVQQQIETEEVTKAGRRTRANTASEDILGRTMKEKMALVNRKRVNWNADEMINVKEIPARVKRPKRMGRKR